MPQKRLFGLAAVLLNGVCAGTIASNSGSATVTPTPRRNVRRGMCFFVMNIAVVSLVYLRTALSSTFIFIWKGGLLTMPTMSDEKWLLLRDASRTIARTAGIS